MMVVHLKYVQCLAKAQRPKVTLKDLQSSTATGVSVHGTIISHTIHRAGLYGRVARKKALPSVRNKKAHFEFPKKACGRLPKCMEKGALFR